MDKIYPDSEVELNPWLAKHYDKIMNIASLGFYIRFIHKAISSMDISPNDKILDFGAGTGRNALLMNKYLSERGEIVGLDISDNMIKRFKEKTKKFPNISIKNKRIDQPIDFEKRYDKVFISFALHGFPQEIRKIIINNAFNGLKEEGEFIILDYNEVVLNETPFYFRTIFKAVECKYAFDFIKRDWKKILGSYGFNEFEEKTFFLKYVRLLKAKKIGERK